MVLITLTVFLAMYITDKCIYCCIYYICKYLYTVYNVDYTTVSVFLYNLYNTLPFDLRPEHR